MYNRRIFIKLKIELINYKSFIAYSLNVKLDFHNKLSRTINIKY